MENFFTSLEPYLKLTYFGNTIEKYLIALAILLGFLIFFKFLKNKIFYAFELIALRTKSDLDDEILKNIKTVPGGLYLFGALFFAIQVIEVSDIVTKIIEIGLIILGTYWLINVVTELIEFGLFRIAKKNGVEAPERTNAFFALSFLSKFIFWAIGLLLILSNLGVDITALTTSLGIGGIAIALAVQNILGDMLSSFSLYMDKPFEVGDFIVVGPHMGTVKKIGLKSTRIQALQGEEIIISNNELTTARVQNFKKLEKRRIEFEVAVAHETKTKILEKIPGIIKKIVEGVKIVKVEFGRAHLARLSNTGLMFEIVYSVNSSDYEDYMNIQQEINLNVLKSFEKEKIKIAFPTQSLYLKKEGK